MTYPTKKLEEVAEVEYGTRVVKSRNEPGDYYVYGGGGKTFTTSSWNRESCVIISRFGMSENCVRRVDGRFFLNDSGLSVRSKDEQEMTTHYLDWILFTFQSKIYALGRGQAQKNLDVDRFRELEIPMPPIAEQGEIIARIEKQFAKIDEAARLRAESEKLAAELLPAALHEIFSSAESKGWKMVAVGDLCDIKGGKRLPKGHVFATGETKYPYIRVADFVPYGIDQSSLKYITDETFKSISRYTISKHDVFISIAGTIGSAGIIPENLDGANLTENAAKLTNLKNVDQRYLMFMLTSKDAKLQMTGDMIQTTIAKLGLFRIARLKIPLPPLAQQKVIVKKLDALSTKARALRDLQSSQSTDLKVLKHSILHQAFSQ
ncbi:MAG: restriction endonuclease subunit S [Parcubacteria group bacterium]